MVLYTHLQMVFIHIFNGFYIYIMVFIYIYWYILNSFYIYINGFLYIYFIYIFTDGFIWCLMNSQPTFLFLTYLNLMNHGHIIKSM